MSFLSRQFEDLFEWFYFDLPKGFVSAISGGNLRFTFQGVTLAHLQFLSIIEWEISEEVTMAQRGEFPKP
jgi:hypothetical protein